MILLFWLLLWILAWSFFARDKKKTSAYLSEWDRTRENALNHYGKICNLCGSTNELQVHHKMPRALGWTDDLQNLTVLCKNCHEEEHGYEFSETSVNLHTQNKKMSLINEAIITKSKLSISYINTFTWEITERVISPIELYKKDYTSQSWYHGYHWFVSAYCHMRNEERNFQVRKIKSISTA